MDGDDAGLEFEGEDVKGAVVERTKDPVFRPL